MNKKHSIIKGRVGLALPSSFPTKIIVRNILLIRYNWAAHLQEVTDGTVFSKISQMIPATKVPT